MHPYPLHIRTTSAPSITYVLHQHLFCVHWSCVGQNIGQGPVLVCTCVCIIIVYECAMARLLQTGVVDMHLVYFGTVLYFGTVHCKCIGGMGRLSPRRQSATNCCSKSATNCCSSRKNLEDELHCSAHQKKEEEESATNYKILITIVIPWHVLHLFIFFCILKNRQLSEQFKDEKPDLKTKTVKKPSLTNFPHQLTY